MVPSLRTRSLTHNLVQHTFYWVLSISNVKKPICDTDFLSYFNLLVITNCHLVDVVFTACPTTPHKIATVLSHFPTLIQLQPISAPPKHMVTHHINSIDLSTSTHVYRLAPECLLIVC